VILLAAVLAGLVAGTIYALDRCLRGDRASRR